jgi:NtrC-family two-component system sensor histidine kinase KinB
MRWTLRKKIILGYGAAILIIIVVLIWAFINLLKLGQASDAILKENYKSILAAENMIDAIERQDSATLLLLLGFPEEGLEQFRQNEANFLQWFGRAKDNITIKGEEEIVDAIDQGYNLYLVNFSKLNLLRDSGIEQAVNFYHETLLASFISVRDACIGLRVINETTMFAASNRAKLVADRSIVSMVVVGLAALGLGLAFSLMLSNLLTRPVRQIMEGARKIAQGNYDVQISDTSSDELGRLAGEFNLMVRKLKNYHDLNIGQLLAEKSKSEAIIKSIEDGIIVVDAGFRIVDLNPAAAKAIGVEIDQAKGKHFLEVFKNEKLFDLIKHSAESGQCPRVEAGKDVISVDQQNGRGHYQGVISPVYSKDNNMLGVVLLLRDVTRLKELDNLKSEFIMMASHELRTPLTSIGMSIDLLLERGAQKLSHEEQKLLAAAHEEIQRLKSLVNDLLTLSKIESGKIELEFEPVAIAALFEKVVSDMRVQADNKSIELSFKVPDGFPKVKADAQKIAWVLTNLISNALKFIEKRGYIRLSAEQIGTQAYLSVKDNGAGIPFEDQSRIFDKFVQAKNQKDYSGSGLGLAISKEIVHAHGGTIWVDSVPGEGSTFTFTLPVAQRPGKE